MYILLNISLFSGIRQKYALIKRNFILKEGAYNLGRHKEAVIGILEFIQENEDLFKSKFEDKTRFITKHLNLIGGVKPISYYDRSFFKNELKKISVSINSL